MLSLGLAMLTLFVATPQDKPEPRPWFPVKSADGLFSAEMPAEAKMLNQESPNPAGPIRQVTHYCKVGGSLYTVQSIARPGEIAEADRQATLDRDRDAYIAEAKGKVIREIRTTPGGLPGWDFTIEETLPGQPGIITARVAMVLSGTTLLTAAVMSPPGKPLPAENARFFDAFKPAPAGPAAPVADATPDQALRSFLIALALGDEPTLRAVALPAADFEVLLTARPPTPAQAVAVRVGLAAQSIRTLPAGAEFTLPGGRKMTVTPEEVTDDRAVLLPQGAPTPTRLQKVAGRWRVDARPFIAARKAAAAARAKAEAKSKGSGR